MRDWIVKIEIDVGKIINEISLLPKTGNSKYENLIHTYNFSTKINFTNIFCPPRPLEGGLIGSKFWTNFILFAKPKGVNLANLGCSPKIENQEVSLVLKGRNVKLYCPFRADG